MSHSTPEELFRQAAEAEGGMPVSAGVRLSHLRMAVESGRAFYVDLSSVPEEKRLALVAEIQEMVDRAGGRQPGKSHHDLTGQYVGHTP